MNINKDELMKCAKKAVEIAVYVGGIALSYVSVRDVIDGIKYSGEVDYGDAVDAIMSSDMMSSYKEQAVTTLKKDESSQFYKAVIRVIKSDMMSSYKVDTIRKMSE